MFSDYTRGGTPTASRREQRCRAPLAERVPLATTRWPRGRCPRNGFPERDADSGGFGTESAAPAVG